MPVCKISNYFMNSLDLLDRKNHCKGIRVIYVHILFLGKGVY